MLKQLCQLELVIAEKTCRFTCENDTDINIIKEALFQFQKFIGSVEDIAKAKKEAEEKANVKVEEPVNLAPDAIDPPAHLENPQV